MDRDARLQEGLQRSKARFVDTMNSILERYNHPFEDDFLVSMDTLTYDTPDGKNFLNLQYLHALIFYRRCTLGEEGNIRTVL
uniref:Uncharacterized protein n=1 Tax=Malurus cyaneus samueli TaxID=2593467 RepID=A0A8C5TIC4_9PASS